MPLDVIVLAAGQGKRMRSELPKVLHPIAGRPLLAHVLDTAGALNARKTVVVYGHGGEQVRTAFAQAQVEWVLQSQQLGTGHAVRQAMAHVDGNGDILILYGDVPLVRVESLKRLIEAAREGLAVMTTEVEEPKGYGRIVRNSGGNVERIVEEKDASSTERAIREINAGFMALSGKRLGGWLGKINNHNAQKEYYLTDVVTLAVKEGTRVIGVKVHDPMEVAGVNSKAELAALERAYQREQARRLMEAGVSLADPARIDVRGELQCAREVAIDVNCVFEGLVKLGEGVRIGPNCVLRNVTVGAGSEVLAFSHLEESEVGARCRVGPYARLRPGASLAEEVHVGNFVEVKASRLGARSKANHLSYVGDSEIGTGVNIGAGTITCNYDGVQKNRTVIEDDCFIGSDTTLVAPVRVARGSYIGAGSTITKDTPAGQLTLARGRQVSIPAWKPPKKKG
jgi:bifunctional UDP-N-acetylglucosamine pyrophosphorylase / glucosamine-1-phosphate N-acetyltransferase